MRHNIVGSQSELSSITVIDDGDNGEEYPGTAVLNDKTH